MQGFFKIKSREKGEEEDDSDGEEKEIEEEDGVENETCWRAGKSESVPRSSDPPP